MLTIDYANCLSDRVAQHGVEPERLDKNAEPAAAIASLTRKIAVSRNKPADQGGWERWRDLPNGAVRKEHVSAVKALVARFKPATDNLVVLGIGGSALGNIALQGALNSPTYNLAPSSRKIGPRIFVVDNVDPVYFGSVLRTCEELDPGLRKTVFNVVSKSGETAETASQFMIVRDLLKKRGLKGPEHVVAVTDPAKGTMRKICDQEGYATLPVPEGVGGRFSVLSPVGLFSGAMAGIDIDALLDGAASMDAPCSREDILANPAAVLAFLLVELGTEKGKPNHVMMPYSNQLYLLADWFRQLWAESLGKKSDLRGETVYAGFTPIKALGTTDQHSQVQLYREGPNDKVFGLVEVKEFGQDEMTIPTGLGVDAIKYLEGQTVGGLLNAEKRATEYALVESHRPNFTIRFPKIDAYHVGQFIYLWEVVTSYAGLMLNIDAYDQPAVELGKQATFGLMGRAGYEKHLKAVNATLAPTERVWKG
jgi:glucose-6-phosphate isomerase